jgi:DNA polymerase-3 subunit epsilon/exodeoxyribonuclease X
MTHYVLFDTETTGNQEEDRIIQFGAMIVTNKNQPEIFDNLCSCDIDIKIEAMEVHNITPDMIEDKPIATQTPFYKRLEQLNTNENYLIAHNIKFDLGMIEKEGFRSNMKHIDTLRCARHLFDDLPYHRLQYLRYALEIYKTEQEEANKLGIKIKAHDAIGDVLVMKLFLSKLVQKAKQIYPQDNIMEKLVELTNTPVFVKTFKFGKYKGKTTTEVAQEDPSYLNWMRENMKDMDDDMRYTIDTLLS